MRIQFVTPYRHWAPGQVEGRLDDGVATEFLRRGIAVLAPEEKPNKPDGKKRRT